MDHRNLRLFPRGQTTLFPADCVDLALDASGNVVAIGHAQMCISPEMLRDWVAHRACRHHDMREFATILDTRFRFVVSGLATTVMP